MMSQGVMEIQNNQLKEMKEEAKNKVLERRKPIALIESYIRGYSETLNAVREDTKANVERKQVLNEKEFVSTLIIFSYFCFYFYYYYYYCNYYHYYYYYYYYYYNFYSLINK